MNVGDSDLKRKTVTIGFSQELVTLEKSNSF